MVKLAIFRRSGSSTILLRIQPGAKCNPFLALLTNKSAEIENITIETNATLMPAIFLLKIKRWNATAITPINPITEVYDLKPKAAANIIPAR